MAPKVSQLPSCVFLLLLLFLDISHARSEVVPTGEKPSSSFEFIKRLQGCRKGDKVKGLYQLKNYLRKFGYIDNLPDSNSRAEDEDFDGVLESAIKTYQTNHHLNSTGVLDAETVSQMIMPRCGLPDIVNGKNWMHPHIRHRRLLSFHAVSHYSFFPGNPKWPSNQSDLTYGFAPNVPSEFFSPVAMAFATWASQTHFTFKRAENYNVANLQIAMAVGDHGDGAPFDGPGGIQAHATPPTIGTFHFDADDKWSANPSTDALDIQTVSLHEIGHLLGLHHSSVPGSSMWPYTGLGERRRALSDDDLQGIRTLYPYEGGPRAPRPSI